METDCFKKFVETDGKVVLIGLPPSKEVYITVLERTNFPNEIQNWLNSIKARHTFTKMSKEKILEKLNKTRETVWHKRHAN
jgi:hypothetical protein